MSDFYGNGQQPTAFVQPRREYFTKRQTLLVAASTVAAALLGVGCVFGVQDALAAHTMTPATVQQPAGGAGSTGGSGGSGFGFGQGGGSGFGGQAGQAGGNGRSGANGQPSADTQTAATSAQSRGVVLIDTQLGYQSAEAAGTGMVLTSGGEVLTNNHVIEGATAITVKVVSTGQTYTAKVVGDDPTADVAVLQLQGASGLTTAKFDTSGGPQTGDAVVGVGNAGGGGQLLAASGEVTGLGRSITTQAEGSDPSESLSGLIETDAPIEAGDSGGPLYDASGEIVGMDTAASDGGAPDSYAIPIATAVDLAHKIASGSTAAGIDQGYPAFLGVEIGQPDAGSFGSGMGSGFGSGMGAPGAQVAGVIDGTPAAAAGLEAGDVITAVDGTQLGSSSALSAALQGLKPGDRVSLSWTDASGQTHTAKVTLAQGPAA